MSSDRYPHSPGHVAGVETSAAAAESMRPSVGTVRRRVLDVIRNSPTGFTCDQIERVTSLSHQTASARCAELMHLGLIAVAHDENNRPRRRLTRSGRSARVYVATT